MPDTDAPLEGTDQLDHESGETPEPPADGESTDPPEESTSQIQALRRENASWRTRLRETEAERDRLRETASTDQESAVAAAREEARAEARAEALAESNARLLRAEVLAAAAGRLRDPSDAVSMLDLSQFQVDDNGEVDRKALATAVDELVKAKPYLAGIRDPEFGARPPAPVGGPSMDDFIRKAAGRA